MLEQLYKLNIFRKSNSLVRSIVGARIYHDACELNEQARLATSATHLCWGRRPYSGLTLILDAPTAEHYDKNDKGTVPAMCTRFGSQGVSDLFILPEYGLKLLYTPGTTVVGDLKSIQHKVTLDGDTKNDLAATTGDTKPVRMSVVHYFRKDIVTEALRKNWSFDKSWFKTSQGL